MVFSVLEIEDLLDKESLLLLKGISNTNNNYNNDYQALLNQLGLAFITKGTETEFINNLNNYELKIPTIQQLNELSLKLSSYSSLDDSLVSHTKTNNKTNTSINNENNEHKKRLEDKILKIMKIIQNKNNEKNKLINNISVSRQYELLLSSIPTNDIHNDSHNDIPTGDTLGNTLVDNLGDNLGIGNDENTKNNNKLKNEVNERKERNKGKETKREELQIKLNELKVKKELILKRESEAIKLSQNKNNKIQELGKWYSNISNELLELLNISSIKPISQSVFEIHHKSTTDEICSRITLNSTGHSINMNLVGIELNLPLNTTNIIQNSTVFANITACLMYVVPQIHCLVLNYQLRSSELNALVSAGALYDHYTNELCIHQHSAYVFRIDECYPLGGLHAVSITAVEPPVTASELLQLNDSMRESGVQTITEYLKQYKILTRL